VEVAGLFSAVGALTDRYCMFNGNLSSLTGEVISPQPLISCTTGGGSGYDNACGGGLMAAAWSYLRSGGASTCLRDCTAGCSPYKSANCRNDVNHNGCYPCTSKCDAGNYYKYYTNSENYFSGFTNICNSIRADGPVQTCFKVYENFNTFFASNPNGIYSATGGAYLGNHCVRITGWNTTNGVVHWLVANSWGRNWGSGGWFKVKANVNLADFETYIATGCPIGRVCSRFGSEDSNTNSHSDHVAGGGFYVDLDIGSETIRKASMFLEGQGVSHTVVSAQSQVVAGLNLKLKINKTGLTGELEPYDVDMHLPLDGAHRLVSMNPSA